MEKKKYFDELNVFRALVIIWVVLGHSTDASQGDVYAFFHNYAYAFHMRAFMLLSGMLFFPKFKRIQSLKDGAITVLDRFKRLMIPYFVYTLISYLLKLVFGEFANNALSQNIIVDTLLGINNPNGGIWFLHTLFVQSIVAVVLCKFPLWLLFAGTAVLRVVTLFIPIDVPVIDLFCSYAVFFYGGMLLFKYYNRLSTVLQTKLQSKKAKIILYSGSFILLCASLIAVWWNVNTNTGVLYSCLFHIIAIVCIVTWYCISLCVCTVPALKKIAMGIGNYGMDIYVLGYYVQIFVRVVFITILGAPHLLCSALMFFGGLLLPIPVSKYIIRKVPLFKAIFLGDFPKKKKAKLPAE